MFEILAKRQLNPQTVLMDIHAPLIAKACRAGQFIIFRIKEEGERVPLTICDADREAGSIRIVFQMVGKSTMELGSLAQGDFILDLVGPLGHPTEIGDHKKVCVVVGGLGAAIGFMTAKQMHQEGLNVDIVAGFRSKDMVILEEEMKAASSNLYLCTDDGSAGFQGFVTDKLKALCDENDYDMVITIGPLVMMKLVSKVTEAREIFTLASMNPIMIDGSGMCGGCRVTVGGKMCFACVDGPDFDAHKVDFEELITRNLFYKKQETEAKEHFCHLTGEVRSHE